MKNIIEKLNQGKVIVSDGAWGTMLFQRGLAHGDAPEKMNLENPQVLQEIAQLYIEAGAELITTNTFGGSPAKLSDYKLEEKVKEINSIGASAIKKIVPDNVFVSGSVGPTGKILQPFGDTEPEKLFEGFKMQIGALVDGGADIICVETMIDVTEASLAVEAAKSINPDIPVIACMTFDKTPNGFFTIMGVSIESAIMRLLEVGADIIGSNCGNGIDRMIEIALEFKKFTDQHLIIQSNAGLPQTVDGKLTFPETPQYFAEKSVELINAGVSIIGGCCGSTPDHIKAIRKVVDACNSGETIA